MPWSWLNLVCAVFFFFFWFFEHLPFIAIDGDACKLNSIVRYLLDVSLNWKKKKNHLKYSFNLSIFYWEQIIPKQFSLRTHIFSLIWYIIFNFRVININTNSRAGIQVNSVWNLSWTPNNAISIIIIFFFFNKQKLNEKTT